MATNREYFDVSSVFGAKTGEPMVQIRFRGGEIKVSPEDARALAENLLHSAEAAIADASLMTWARTEMKMADGIAVALMASFRSFRAKRERQ